jgi:hypothetical protein
MLKRIRRVTVSLVAIVLSVGSSVSAEDARHAHHAEAELRELEATTAIRETIMKALTPDKLESKRKAAIDFAKSVAGQDDSRFVQTFRDAFNVSVNAELPRELKGTHGAAVEPQITATALPANSIYLDPAYVANARKLIEQSARIIGGVPTTDFADCVAVGSESEWCCSGTLVAKNVVITAGHCYPNCVASVFFGKSVHRPEEGRIVRSSRRYVIPSMGSAGSTMT